MGTFYRSDGNKRFKRCQTNIIELIKQREINERSHLSVKRKLHVTANFVKRIGLEAELEGHVGCVNCIEWNSRGNLLVSSSDDTHIIMWDPFRRKMLDKFKTVHEGNIFGTKFLPSSSDTQLITGAADNKIVLQDILLKETLTVCVCSLARVKRIETCYDTPHLYWSASEDGVIRQMDTRIQHECNAATKNILINLRNHRRNISEAKCLAINPMKSELLAVGANDAFVRLYDRRMIKLSSGEKMKVWLRRSTDNNGGRQNGRLNRNEEFRDVQDNLPTDCVQYFTPGHLQTKRGNGRYRYVSVTFVAFSPNGGELLANFGNEHIYLFDMNRNHVPKYFNVPHSYLEENDITENSNYKHDETFENEAETANEKDTLPKPIEDLKSLANELFQERNYTRAIDIYNYSIMLCNNSAVLYCNRAASFMKRDWKGDMYAATRDCIKALKLNSNYMKAHFRLTRCYYELKRFVEAKTCMDLFIKKYPKSSISPACKALEKDINKDYSKTVGAKTSSSRLGMQISRQEKSWQENSFDYEQRYCGHCNTTTDIKEANFFGSNGQFIVAGSDEGSIYFWDRETENIEHVLVGDNSIVNCVQPHKEMCFLASSGIDSVVRLWSPRSEDGSENERVVKNIPDITQTNQRRMRTDPLEVIFRSRNSSSQSDSDSYEEPVLTCRPT